VTTTPPENAAGIDPSVEAANELAHNTVPTPDDLLADVGPLTQLWYLRELSYSVMRILAATLSIGDGEAPPDDSAPVRALAVVSTVAGELDGACTLVGLLPDDYADNVPA
jgi:hypothetical protein